MLSIVITFAIALPVLIYVDLACHRGAREITLPDALTWSAFYVGVGLAFAAATFVAAGPAQGSLFLSAYVLEKALSVDNLVVFGAVFAYFGVKGANQHRVLYYGVLGAVILRLVFVLLGTGALKLIGAPVQLLFAAFVAWSALKIFRGGDDSPEEIDHASRWYVRALAKLWPVDVASTNASEFFVKRPHILRDSDPALILSRWCVTPLFVCLVSIEVTDIMFAFDSVPVVVAVARDPLIIYPAMMLAVLGLRSMYFVLAALQGTLKHLNAAIGVVLLMVAAKLAGEALFHLRVDPYVSLTLVLAVLSCGVIASLLDAKESAHV